MKKDTEANNPETGTANSFRSSDDGRKPAEAGDSSSDAGLKDKGDLGRASKMDKTSLQEEEGVRTMDEKREGEE